jgi:hypothetical protein
MPSTVLLQWRDLVAQVKSGQLEPRTADGANKFMFWRNSAKASFLSDPALLDQIIRARNHRNPFVLIGPQHTGKNIFLQLDTSSSSRSAGIRSSLGLRGTHEAVVIIAKARNMPWGSSQDE